MQQQNRRCIHLFAGQWIPKTGGEKFNREIFSGPSFDNSRLSKIDLYEHTHEAISRWLPRLRFLLRLSSVRSLLVQFSLLRTIPANASLVIVAYQDYRPLPVFQILLKLMKRVMGFRVLIIVHHMDDYRSEMEGRLRRGLCAARANLLLGAADAILTISQYSLNEIKSLGHPTKALHVIFPGVEERAAWRHERGTKTSQFLCVSHIVARKGILDLIKAFATLDDATATLLIIGSLEMEPDYSAQVVAEIHKRGLSGRVVLAGRVDDDFLAKAYRESICFVFCSHFEGFGIAIVEAMRAGLPVIAYSNSAIPELVRDRENGHLVRTGDTQLFGIRMHEMLEDPSLREKLSLCAKASVEGKFTWHDAREQFALLVDRLCI